ncbi:MAG TPA: dihydrofolate reductase [Lachnospiraceae bacterium]|jgi:dihydrofolate reductase|nr:dihydrofolate reductase [Lachnospiraceae bacterium]
MLSIICAVGKKGEIGKDGTMPWHLKEDLKRFKRLTLGHTIIMGRRTFQSLPGVLPKRAHIVISRDPSFTVSDPRVKVSGDLDRVLKEAVQDPEEVFLIGGGSLYKQSIAMAQKMYLTHIDSSFEGADTFFPEFSDRDFMVTFSSGKMTDPESGLVYEFVDYERG